MYTRYKTVGTVTLWTTFLVLFFVLGFLHDADSQSNQLWYLKYQNGTFYLKPSSSTWKLDSTLTFANHSNDSTVKTWIRDSLLYHSTDISTLTTGNIVYYSATNVFSPGPKLRGLTTDSILVKSDALGISTTQDRVAVWRGTKGDSLGFLAYALGTASAGDSTYWNAQRVLRIPYTDTTSSLAMRHNVAAKIGVVGYSVGDTTAFSTTATRLAVYVVGARASQIWAAFPRIGTETGLPGAGEWIIARAKWDSVIFKRNTGTTSALQIDYFRVK
jgi:hypothetical protein